MHQSFDNFNLGRLVALPVKVLRESPPEDHAGKATVQITDSPENLAHLYNITSTLTIWNRLVQLSIVYEIRQSNYRTMKMLKFGVKIYINFDHLW